MLGLNIAIADTAQVPGISRQATADEWEAAIKQAMDDRFGRYEGNRIYNFGINIEGYVLAPPGVPVASLVARGEVELGFQQLSELIHVEGITLVGGMPSGVEILTVFSAGLPVGLAEGSAQAERVRALLHFMTSPDAEEAKRRQGMEPA